MNVHDATEQAYKNGYAAARADFDALLADVSGYQGSICCYCKHIVRGKGIEPSCKVFGDFPTSYGMPLSCGRWEWRGAQ